MVQIIDVTDCIGGRLIKECKTKEEAIKEIQIQGHPGKVYQIRDSEHCFFPFSVRPNNRILIDKGIV